MLRFLVDEDLPRSTAQFVREHGFEADDIRDLGLSGHSDQEIFERAQSLSAVLLTGDIDFANVLRFPPGSQAGIVVSRLPDEISTDAFNQLPFRVGRASTPARDVHVPPRPDLEVRRSPGGLPHKSLATARRRAEANPACGDFQGNCCNRARPNPDSPLAVFYNTSATP